MREEEVVHASRLIAGKDNRIVLWRNNVGQAVFGKEHRCPKCNHRFRDEKPRRVAYGVGGDGGSDYLGIVRKTGRFVAWEFKGDGGRVSKDQQMFLDLVAACGGASELIWTPDQVPAAIERACCE
jgi:hypothetical protein